MSKYNKGDRFIVEIKEVMESKNGTLYRSDFSTLTFDDYGLDKLEKYDEVKEKLELIDELKQAEYNRGLQDAWGLARKIVLEPDEYNNVFLARDLEKYFDKKSTHDILKDYTPQEALAKIEAYEKEQEQIKVGDVVECSKRIFVVTYITSDSIRGIDEDGKAFATSQMEYVKKTGKHIDIASLLVELGKE